MKWVSPTFSTAETGIPEGKTADISAKLGIYTQFGFEKLLSE